MDSTSTWRTVDATSDLPSYKTFGGALEKSQQDDRMYRLLQLENGLKAVVIHDSQADKAAACLEVAVGHLHDPFDMPGLAHFCEHMLSKGSVPFPAENEFLSFIASNGGSRNAATGPSYTNYWFSIGPDLLKGAISRFSASFHSPLFTASVTEREINAVDSENKKNLQDDSRRLFQLTKALSTEGHPWTKFGTGNVESLTQTARDLDSEGKLPRTVEVEGDGGVIGRETRRRLIEWWKNEYCAGRMTLAVLGKESLEDLTGIVVKEFTPIPNLGLDPRPQINDFPWGPSEQGIIVYVKTIKDFQSFTLTFTLPYQQPQFRAKPARFISHLLGHEGPGSVYAYLKKKGWLTSLSSGSQTWNRGIQTFQISGRLTRAGYNHHSEVLQAIFNYIALLRSSSFPSYHYDEVKALSEINFRFKEKSQPHAYVAWLASELAESYPPEWLLSASSVVREWNEGSVHECLKEFIPEKGRVMLMAQEHNGVDPKNGWNTERWYGTQYQVGKLDAAIPKHPMDTNINAELFLPHPNPFIPTSLGIEKVDMSEPAKYPRVLRESELGRLWHKKDDQFWVPKTEVSFDIRSPLAYATPRHAVLTRLMVNLVEDALSEITYDAYLAGLDYSVDSSAEGFGITVRGYSDKLSVLLRMVLEKIKLLEVDPRRLEVMAEHLELSWKNFYLSQPTTLSSSKLDYLMKPVLWTPAEKLLEIHDITPFDIEKHRNELLSRVYVEALANGNVQEQDAIDLMIMVEEVLKPDSPGPADRLFRRSLVLPKDANLVRQETLTDPQELNSSLSYYCHFGSVTDQRSRACTDLVAHILREPCFSQLRTREQLGYIVSSSRWTTADNTGICITIQSLRDPAFLETRVEAFLDMFRKEVRKWSEQDLEVQKKGLIVTKLQRLKNLGQESARFWSHIQSGYYDFIRHETDAANIQQLSLSDLWSAYDLLLPSSGIRRKLSIHTRSQTLPPATAPESMTLIEDENIFKAGLDVSAAPVPVELTYLMSPNGQLSRSRL